MKRYGLTILACFAVAALTVVLTGAATRDGDTTAVQLDQGPRTLDEAEAARETVSKRAERAGKRRAAVRAARIERAEAAATAARERAVRRMRTRKQAARRQGEQRWRRRDRGARDERAGACTGHRRHADA